MCSVVTTDGNLHLDAANSSGSGIYHAWYGGSAGHIFGNGSAVQIAKIDSAGNFTLSGTVDGVDIAARNAVLTSTTTTANAALAKTGGTMTGNTLVNNYGIGLVGLYSATRYQNVFAMGNSYKLSTDGTSAGNLYGIAYTHTNIGGQSKSGLAHQALFMSNGVTQSAVGHGIWTSGVITTTNNIVVSGTVDGRNVSTDGTKLDTIATNANYITNNNQLINGAGYSTGGGSGTITGVTAGTNLSGGGTSGTVTLTVISNPTFTGQLSAHGDISLGNNIGSKLYTGRAQLYANGTATYLTQSSTTTYPIYIESADVRLRVRNSTNSGYVDLVTSTTGQDCQLHANGFVKLLTRNDGVTITGSCSTTTGFLAASDINLKENIETIYDPLEKLKQLNGYTFDWKETGKKSAGVIAQEVEKVMPELVHGDDTKSVDYNGLIGLLIETVKAQQVQIDDLNKRIEA
jgi:hypothetical protein